MISPDTREAIGGLEQRLITMIEGDRRETTIREEARAEALRAALDLNNQRLDSMNEFRSALSDQANTMISRVESDAARNALELRLTQAFRDVSSRIEAELNPMRAAVDAMGRPNWVLLISSVSILFVAVAGIWLVIGLKIDASLAPVAQEVAQQRLSVATLVEQNRNQDILVSASTQDLAASKADRAQLNVRLGALESSVATGASDRRAAVGQLTASLSEVETQFRAISDMQNTQADTIQQWLGLLWEKVYRATMPVTRFRSQMYKKSVE